MLTIIRHILPLAAAAVLLNACNDTPAPDERYIPQGSVEINSKVLIEEFTGQLCVNCPTAHAEMKRFAEMFGHENIISVSIHGNSGAQMAIPAPAGLGTEEGAEYNRRNNIASWPSAIVGRRSGNLESNYGKWLTWIVSDLIRPQQTDIETDASLSADGKTLSIHTRITSRQNVKADSRLQLWIVEDDVTGPQLTESGRPDPTYVHNHVFRAAVNGLDGQPAVPAPKDPVELTHTISVEPKWNPANLSVVTILSSASEGVIGVSRTSITTTDNQNN